MADISTKTNRPITLMQDPAAQKQPAVKAAPQQKPNPFDRLREIMEAPAPTNKLNVIIIPFDREETPEEKKKSDDWVRMLFGKLPSSPMREMNIAGDDKSYLTKMREKLHALGVNDEAMDVGVKYYGYEDAPVRPNMVGNRVLEPEEIYQAALKQVDEMQANVLDETPENLERLAKVEDLAEGLGVHLPFSTVIPEGTNNLAYSALLPIRKQFHDSLRIIRAKTTNDYDRAQEIYRHLFGKPQDKPLERGLPAPVGIEYRLTMGAQPLATGSCPLETYEEKAGICAETAGLLYAALRSVGFKKVEMCEADRREIQDSFILKGFGHAVARLTLDDGRQIILDPSVEKLSTTELEGFDKRNYEILLPVTLNRSLVQYFVPDLGMMKRPSDDIDLRFYHAVPESYESVMRVAIDTALAAQPWPISSLICRALINDRELTPELKKAMDASDLFVQREFGAILSTNTNPGLSRSLEYLATLKNIQSSVPKLKPDIKLENSRRNMSLVTGYANFFPRSTEADQHVMEIIDHIPELLPPSRKFAFMQEQLRIEMLGLQASLAFKNNPTLTAQKWQEALMLDLPSTLHSEQFEMLRLKDLDRLDVTAKKNFDRTLTLRDFGEELFAFPEKDLAEMMDVQKAVRQRGATEANSASAHAIAALISEKKGDIKAARENLQKALALEPQNPLLLLVEIGLIERAGNAAQALARINALIAVYPLSKHLQAERFRLALGARDLQQARQSLEIVNKEGNFYEEDSPIHGYMNFLEGRMDQLDPYFSKVSESREWWEHQAAGQVQEALAAMHEKKGEKVQAQKALNLAIESYEHALSQLPALEPAKSNLEKLRKNLKVR